VRSGCVDLAAQTAVHCREGCFPQRTTVVREVSALHNARKRHGAVQSGHAPWGSHVFDALHKSIVQVERCVARGVRAGTQWRSIAEVLPMYRRSSGGKRRARRAIAVPNSPIRRRLQVLPFRRDREAGFSQSRAFAKVRPQHREQGQDRYLSARERTSLQF